MSLQLVGSLNDLTDNRVLYIILNSNDNGLVHLVADNLTCTGLSQISLFHNHSFRCHLVCLGSQNSLNSCNILANLFDSAGII